MPQFILGTISCIFYDKLHELCQQKQCVWWMKLKLDGNLQKEYKWNYSFFDNQLIGNDLFITGNDSIISNVQIKQKIHDRFAFVTISSQLLIILFSLSTRKMKINTSKRQCNTTDSRNSNYNTSTTRSTKCFENLVRMFRQWLLYWMLFSMLLLNQLFFFNKNREIVLNILNRNNLCLN